MNEKGEIMKIDEIRLIYDYNYWAAKRLLTAAANINQEQYTTAKAFPHNSLRGTFIHLLDAEYGWRMLCQEGLETKDLTESELPTLDALQIRWHEEEAAMRVYLGGLKDEHLTGIIRYTTPKGIKRERVLWHCLYHVVNHGTQHRSEAAAILTDLGHSPGDFDFSIFMVEKN
jgi:uncharacterized damage-inducible protein DinB